MNERNDKKSDIVYMKGVGVYGSKKNFRTCRLFINCPITGWSIEGVQWAGPKVQWAGPKVQWAGPKKERF